MNTVQAKQSLNKATNDIAKHLIDSGIVDNRDDARIILSKALVNREVLSVIKFSCVKEA